MAKTLVLVRHGKAAARTPGSPDALRSLTAAGKRSLAAWLPRSRELLGDAAENAVIWTSGALRTQETAEIVAETFGVRAVEERPCLTECDLGAFLEDLSDAEEECVVAVGHNPFVEDVVARLTGAAVPCSPGSVVAIGLTDRDAAATAGSEADSPWFGGWTGAEGEKARLLWFVQGPRSSCWKALCELDEMLGHQAKRTEKRLAGFLGDPNDVEALHDFRVAARTLRSLLSFCKPFLKRSAWRKADRRLSRAVGLTSRLRDLDILIEDAEAMNPPAVDLLAACRSERDRACVRVVRALGSKKAGRDVARVCAAARLMPWRESVEAGGLASEEVALRFARMVDRFGVRMADADYVDEEATHDLRKQAKRLRYAAENVPGLPKEEAGDIARLMREVQDELGALCDARVRVAIIEAFPTARLSADALRDLDILKAKSLEFIRSFPYPKVDAEGEEPVAEEVVDAGVADVEPAAEVPADAMVAGGTHSADASIAG